MADNPPAFPIVLPHEYEFADGGMTLRDWFAGQALAGLSHVDPWVGANSRAQAAYEQADAMLTTREAQHGNP